MSFNFLGTGMYVPDRIVTNTELARIVETSDEWITQRVGVRERRICTDETAADLAFRAAERALADSGCSPGDLDLIISASVSGENSSPSVACTVQGRLGAACPAFEINAACPGFIVMLETAAGYFARGNYKKILVIGAERMSRIVDWDDRSTCVIFGDGAGAAVLEKGSGYINSTFTVKGGDDVICIPNNTGKSPFYTGRTEEPYIRMNGQETFKYAVNAICTDIHELLDKSGLSSEDISYIVPHQANKRIIDFAARKLGIPEEKFFINIEKYGNTSGASIPIALDEMNKNGLLKRGDILILTAFGGGLANASCLVRW